MNYFGEAVHFQEPGKEKFELVSRESFYYTSVNTENKTLALFYSRNLIESEAKKRIEKSRGRQSDVRSALCPTLNRGATPLAIKQPERDRANTPLCTATGDIVTEWNSAANSII